ncbi:MAG: NAD-dependent epimerase/dehydratase family protein [Steroidobacteraceae bacterium]
MERRNLIKWALGAVALGAVGAARFVTTPSTPKPLDILVLGGTGFLGPHQIEPALARGHRVTMFNRGITAAGLYGERVETLIGNRDARVDQGLKALAGTRRWDIVIDNSGFIGRHVRDSAELLHGRVGRYLFVSTISAYDLLEDGGTFREDSPLSSAATPDDELSGYGPMKAVCDRVVREVYGNSALIVRPTYIVGPRDETDRFTYWIDRMSRGGEVLGPPDPAKQFQWIDVRDLGNWMISLAEQGTTGVFNAASKPMAWGDILGALAAASGQKPHIHAATVELLDELGIDQPLVLSDLAQWFISTAAAEETGLTIRPLADTAAATLAWWRAQPAERHAKTGWLTPERELQAIEMLSRTRG